MISNKKNLIFAEDLVSSINRMPIHLPITFKLFSGEMGVLTGENGCGKTTFLRTLLGEYRIYSGILRIFNDDIKYNDQKIINKYKVCVIPQYAIAPNDMTIIEYLSVWDYAKKNIKNRMTLYNVIKSAGDILETKVNKYMGELSYGQKRLIDILLATSANPSIIFADEPFAGLTMNKIEWCLDRFTGCIDNECGILIVLHNYEKQYLKPSWECDIKNY